MKSARTLSAKIKNGKKDSKLGRDLVDFEPKNGVFVVSEKWAKKLKRKKKVKK